ncbi:putative transmembrane protein [Tieghemostelium lacteum]|uniref:Putative transmembrane protein n=1 Tax=Tieghemostelium lacteum TaxID=361077 RepID=A0A151ZIH2_TIELA|nr:putative transmembrane protein [Tieghemostelium lacteum]|eukprot:KYQ93756.1 putative transmembrane protein [Tieghemostelium lacteum]
MKISLILLAVLLVSIVRSDDPVYPTFPTNKYYSTYVSYNDFVHGYTFAYKEFFSQPDNVSRTESTDVLTVDWKNNVFYAWDSHFNTTINGNCTTGPLNSAWHAEPSYTFLTQYKNITYIGTETIDRKIQCAKFQTQENKTFDDPYTCITFSLNNIKMDLVRAQLNDSTCLDGWATSANITDSSVISLDCFLGKARNCTFTQQSSFTSFQECIMKSSATVNDVKQFGSNTTAIQETSCPRPGGTVSLLVSIFLNATQLSQPIRLSAVGNQLYPNGSSFDVSFIVDWVDYISTDNQQTEVYKLPQGCTPDPLNFNFTVPTKQLLPADAKFNIVSGHFSLLLEPVLNGTPADSIIWRYDAVNNYQSIEIDTLVGDNITVFNDNNQKSYSINTYTKKCVYNNKWNPLYDNPRYQPFYRIIDGQLKDINYTYVRNTDVKRGVNVDTWSTSLAVGAYNFNVTIYTFNKGWKFPGRYGISAGDILPLSVETQGTDDKGVAFNDIFDIFFYAYEFIPNSYLSQDSMHCLPETPVNYTSLVYINQEESGSSYSYFETVDSQNQLSYSQGRYQSFNMFTVVDLKNLVYSEWMPNTTTCNSYNLPNLTDNNDYIRKINYAPSLEVFYSMAEEIGPVEYVGLVTEQIKILQFRSQFQGVRAYNGFTYNITRFAFLNWIPGTSIPHSVHFISHSVDINTGAQKTHNTYVYWSMFVNNQTGLTGATKPPQTTCTATNQNAPTGFSLNTTYAVPSLSSNTPRPESPTLFTTYIEVKTIKADGTYTILPVKWQYSQSQLVEKFTIYNPQNYTPTDYKYCYQGNMGGNAKVLINNKSLGIAGINSSPLYGGDGSLLRFFYDKTYYQSAQLQMSYIIEKGVPAETYVISGTNQTCSFMYYPKGWTIFGEVPTSRVPLTIIRNNTGNNTVEVWSFFRFSNDVEPNITDNCALSTEEKLSGLTGGIIAAIVIVVAVCFIGISAIVFVVIRKRRNIKKQPPHILLDDRNLINQQEVNRVYEN